jgi:dTDP-4-dehydrorhamnose reductase
MRILITGAGGMLGSCLVPELVRQGHLVFATDLIPDRNLPFGPRAPLLEQLDVRRRTDVQKLIEEVQPRLVVHLAALTDLEECEADYDAAYATNAVGTKHVALACQEAGITMAYVSTAGVFDGEKEQPYTEYDAPNPINAYGASKLEGERYVEHFVSRHFIVRAGWMVGGGRKDHKFVAKVIAQLKDGARVIHAVGDKLGTPTYAPDFVQCFGTLIESGSFGLYHMACRGAGSRYDVAERILQALGRDDVDLVEVTSDFFKDDYPAPRPASEMMRNLVLELQGMNTMRDWRESLDEYLSTAFEDLGLGVATLRRQEALAQ